MQLVVPLANFPSPIPEAPAMEVAPELLQQVDEAGYIYVHCSFDNTAGEESLIRIWRTTYLIDSLSGFKAALVHAEQISFAPVWTLVPGNAVFRFLLIFESLPKNCLVFDLLEEIPQPGGFCFLNILRNPADVYHLTLEP